MKCIDHGRQGNKYGYTNKFINGKAHGLHRIVYADEHGVPVEELQGTRIIHSCGNTRCINPQHLLQGTYSTADHSEVVSTVEDEVQTSPTTRSSIMKTHLTHIFFVISVVLYMLGIFSFEVTVLLGLLAILDPQHYPKQK